MYKLCIVGLGNPDKKYNNTRHNIGKDWLIKLSEVYNITFTTKTKFEAEIGESHNGSILWIIPTNYVNNSGKTLSKIINARVVEIIEQAYLEIKNYGHEDSKKKLIAGIVLTGGGSQLRHLKQLVEYITGMDTRIGYPGEHLSGDSNEFNPIYSTAVGLLMKAIENNSEDLTKDISNSTGNDLVNQERKTILAKWGEGFKKFIDNVDNTYDN